MWTGIKSTLRAASHPSLLGLQRALRLAESVVPARPIYPDAHEQRALQLIARMQADYKKAQPFVLAPAGPAPYLYDGADREAVASHAG